MRSGSRSHRRVLPSISVNRNVVTPGESGTPLLGRNAGRTPTLRERDAGDQWASEGTPRV